MESHVKKREKKNRRKKRPETEKTGNQREKLGMKK